MPRYMTLCDLRRTTGCSGSDVLAILEMPDSTTAAKFAITVTSTRAFAHLETHELFSSDEVLELMRGTQGVEYAAPGQIPDFLQHPLP